MTHDQQNEFGILSNVLITLTVEHGGELRVSRDNWSDIASYVVSREYDEETNEDVFILFRPGHVEVNKVH